MNFLKKTDLISLVVMLLALSTLSVSTSHATTINPTDGLIFSQIDLAYRNAVQANSSYGLAAVDIGLMTTNTSISLGYLNIVTAAGWVVRNMPIDISSGYPGISTIFDLGISAGTNVTSLNVFADFSPTPSVTFAGIPSTSFAVGNVSYNAEGKGPLRADLPTTSVDASVITFQFGGLTSATWQSGHPSIEQDTGQCGPASVANSLQWLEDAFGINVPHPHEEGLGDNNDGTLVGELDKDMKRAEDTGVFDDEFMDGKLEYLSDNNLGNNGPGKRIITKHKGGKAIPGNHSHAGLTSKVDTSTLSLTEWIQQEIDHGEDVEMSVVWEKGVWEKGGHWVDLIGAGSVLGVPWVAWTHDAFQDQEGGNNWFDGGIGWSPIVDDKLIMFIEGEFNAVTLDLVVSESVIEVTLVTLINNSFTATTSNGGVTIAWESASEIDNAGFFVWRGQLKAGKTKCSQNVKHYTEVKKISPFIPAQGSGASYSYEDNQVASGNTYCYALEDVDLMGKPTYHLDDITAAIVR